MDFARELEWEFRFFELCGDRHRQEMFWRLWIKKHPEFEQVVRPETMTGTVMKADNVKHL